MASGRASSVKVKGQSTWGSGATFAASGMYDIPFTSEGFKKIQNRDRSANISSGRSYVSRFNAGKKTVGRLAGDANYTRLDHLIASIMGVAGSSAVSDTTAHTNIFSPAATARILDFQVSKGNIPTGKVFQYKCMMGKALEFSWKDKGALTFSWEGVGFDEVSTATTGSDPASSDVTAALDLITVGSQMTTVDIGTGADDAYCVKAGKVRLEQKLTEDDFCNGSDTIAQPDFDDFLVVTGEFTIKFVDRAVYEDFVSQTDLVSDLVWTSTTTVPGAASTKRALKIHINKLNYTSDDGGIPLVDTPGQLLAKIGWEAYGTGGSGATAQPVAIETVNEYDATGI